jgi:hypothetical protein
MDDREHPQPFLSSARALSAAGREFTRLSDEIAERAAGSFGDIVDCKIVVRRSPDRCILQIGTSALTVAFIRNRRESADGELLVMHWRGNVAPSLRHEPERASPRTQSAQVLSESLYIPEATSETDWIWRSRAEPALSYTWMSLAELVIDRLRTIYDEAARSPDA